MSHTVDILLPIVFTLVESSTFYGAVAKGAAAGNLLVASQIEEAIDEYRLIYDLEEEPAPQLVDPSHFGHAG